MNEQLRVTNNKLLRGNLTIHCLACAVKYAEAVKAGSYSDTGNNDDMSLEIIVTVNAVSLVVFRKSAPLGCTLFMAIINSDNGGNTYYAASEVLVKVVDTYIAKAEQQHGETEQAAQDVILKMMGKT